MGAPRILGEKCSSIDVIDLENGKWSLMHREADKASNGIRVQR